MPVFEQTRGLGWRWRPLILFDQDVVDGERAVKDIDTEACVDAAIYYAVSSTAGGTCRIYGGIDGVNWWPVRITNIAHGTPAPCNAMAFTPPTPSPSQFWWLRTEHTDGFDYWPRLRFVWASNAKGGTGRLRLEFYGRRYPWREKRTLA